MARALQYLDQEEGHRENSKKLHYPTVYFLAMVWELRKLVSNNQRSFQSRIKSTKSTS